MNHRRPWAVYLKLLATAFFWGGTFIAGRVVMRDVGPYSAAFLRFAVATCLLLLLTLKSEKRFFPPGRTQMVPIVLLGVTGVFLYNVFFFKGLVEIDAGRAGAIVAINPVVIYILSSLFLREKLTLSKTAGIAVSVAGAVVVITGGGGADIARLSGDGVGRGELFIFGCVLSWATYSLLGKKLLSGMSPLVAVAYSSVAGTAFLFIPACYEGLLKNLLHYSPLDWLGIFYLGFFGTVLGFVWYYEGIKKIGPTAASQFINFVPVSAVVLAFLFLNEPVTRSLIVGTALVCSGVYLVNSR